MTIDCTGRTITVYNCPICEADKNYVSRGVIRHLTCLKCGAKINYTYEGV